MFTPESSSISHIEQKVDATPGTQAHVATQRHKTAMDAYWSIVETPEGKYVALNEKGLKLAYGE